MKTVIYSPHTTTKFVAIEDAGSRIEVRQVRQDGARVPVSGDDLLDPWDTSLLDICYPDEVSYASKVEAHVKLIKRWTLP